MRWELTAKAEHVAALWTLNRKLAALDLCLCALHGAVLVSVQDRVAVDIGAPADVIS